MNNRNYEIFSGDTLVAAWENNNLTVINSASSLLKENIQC